MRRWWRPVVSVAVTAVVVAGACLIQHAHVLDFHGVRLTPFLLAVILSGWVFGVRHAILAACLSLAAISIFWLDALRLGWVPMVLGIALAVLVAWQIGVRRRRQMERAISLRDERSLMRTIIDRIPAFVGYLDADRRYRLHNRMYEAWYPGRDIDGAHLDEVHPAEALAELRPQIERAFAGETVRTIVELDRDGEPCQFDALYIPHKRSGDARPGVAVYAHDITELTAAQRRQAEAERRLNALIEASGALVWRADLDGLYPSAAWEAFTGQPPEAHVGMGWAEAIHPDDRERVVSSWLTARNSPEPWEFRYRLCAADGSYRWVAVTSAPVIDGDGQVREWIGTLRDIELSHQAQRQLRVREAEQRQLLENMPHMAWIADPDGTIHYNNSRWYSYTGLTRAQHWSAAVHPDDIAPAKAHWERALSTGEPLEVEKRYRRASDGEYRWHVVRGVPLRGEDGRILRWFGTCTDIEDQKRALMVLATANERTSRFIAIMSHELRNPLAGIAAAAQLLTRRDLAPAQREPALRTLVRQTEHLRILVDELLDVSRITQGKIEIDREPVDLSEIVRGVCEDAALVARDSAVRVDCAPCRDCVVDGDAGRLRQIVENLVSNAIKASAPGQAVSVSTQRDGDRIRVVVLDRGVGLSPEALSTIFEPFVQVGDRDSRGLGLGLSIAKRLTESHGGNIEAYSAGLGQGVRFTLTLPASARRDAPPPRRETAPAPLSGKVLLVDDELENNEALALLLELEGLSVDTAGDPEIAMSKWKQSRHDIVLCDIELSGPLDGYDLARALRGQADSPYLIAYTGYGQAQDLRRSREAGFDAHITKPGSAESVLAAIREGLAAKR